MNELKPLYALRSAGQFTLPKKDGMSTILPTIFKSKQLASEGSLMKALSLGLAAIIAISVGCSANQRTTAQNNPQQSSTESSTLGDSANQPEVAIEFEGFEKPLLLRAGGEVISVEAPGYACPTVADVDGDGDHDLVVGQFNNGHMQFCENTAGEGKPPEFAAATWIQSGGSRAIVPGVW